MNANSIRFRLISWYAGLLAIIFMTLGLSGYFGLKHYLNQTLINTLKKRAQQIGGTLLADINDQNEDYLVEDINRHYAPEINDRFLRITRDDGSLLYASGLPKDGSFDPTHLPILNYSVDKPFLREEHTPGGVLIYTAPIQTQNSKRYLVEVGVSSRDIENLLQGLMISLLLGLPLVMAIAIGGGYLLIRRALSPVYVITRSAEQITLHNISERLPIAKTGDELERLSISLNNMIARLDAAFQHISRFSADASHELRTPLTILHCDLEAIIQKPKLTEEVREAIGSALTETERLAKIIDSLLATARLDAGEACIDKARLDLSDLTFEIVEQMRLLAEDKDVVLTFQANEKISIVGDAARLKQVIVNLLDNAIKYTPAAGSIDVLVAVDNGKAILTVADTGMGIAAESLPHIFERFYRADKARTRQLGGTGLGLSIVKSICLAHGGYVYVQSEEGKGSAFRVELPLAD
jgi:heavy metal sensor kinase